MSLKHGLLGILNYQSMPGYTLDKAFKESIHFFWQANTSQVYRELNTMEDLGWLSSEWVIQMDKPNKRVYSITEKGKAELLDWLNPNEDDLESAMHIKSAFLIRMFFAGELGLDSTLASLQEYRNKCLECIEYMNVAYEAIDAYDDLVEDKQKIEYWRLTALFGDEYYRAGLIWANKAIERLEALKNK